VVVRKICRVEGDITPESQKVFSLITISAELHPGQRCKQKLEFSKRRV